MRIYILTVLLFVFSKGLAQNQIYSTQKISDSLKQNANAVLRFNETNIEIVSQREMNIKTKRVLTVLNELGLKLINAYENFDKTNKIQKIEAYILDESGNELKHFKRKDFRDQAAFDGFSVFSDNRILYLDYTPVHYPFTIVYECEISTSNTAFIPRWMPLEDYNLSVESSILNVNFPNNLGFKKKEINFQGFNIRKIIDTSTKLSYSASGILAHKQEDLSPSFTDLYPNLLMGLELFNLEGIDGNAKTWKDFGVWYSTKILDGTIELPESTKEKIKMLVGNETNVLNKVAIIYQYLQNKSRYVSIQVGIGGWKPMYAKDVDKLSYGDCKALSNYTRALLEVVNIPSYNTLVYGSKYKLNIDSDFVSMQGNHMILCVPNNGKNIFLECTSQDSPFGYQANFTDDRNVLIMKPDGGEIVHTIVYEDKNNTQKTKSTYTISEDGMISCQSEIVSEGTQYAKKLSLETLQPKDKDAHYKSYFENINNLKIEKTIFTNDKEKISFNEKIEFSALDFGKKIGNNLIFVVNPLNQNNGNIKRIRNRKTPFQIQRGYVDEDEIKIFIPEHYRVESLPEATSIETNFGNYKTEIIKTDNKNLIFKRIMFLKSGKYSNKEYEDFRLFMENIAKNDNAKIVLNKI